MRPILTMLAAATAFAPVTGLAAETITYSYDAKGRLKQVSRANANGNTQTQYTHDKANNRRTKVVTS